MALKLVSLAALSLVSAGLSFGECVEVTARKALPSSGNVRVAVFLEGRPRAGATVEVFLTDKEHGASLRTDIHGVAVLPQLKPGFYSILASSGEDFHADLNLQVPENPKATASAFSMELLPFAFPDTQSALRTAETMPVTEKLQEFKGVVEDQSGAVVPKALIRIIRRGDANNEKSTKIKADESGHFSSPLPDGIYVVLVQAQGFRKEILVFEIASDGQAKELHAHLKVASC